MLAQTKAEIPRYMLEQAINLFKQTLADGERILGPDHPDTLTFRNNLARAYQNAGRLDEAIDLFKQNLTDSERILGPDHHHTLTSRNNLASAYQNAGRDLTSGRLVYALAANVRTVQQSLF